MVEVEVEELCRSRPQVLAKYTVGRSEDPALRRATTAHRAIFPSDFLEPRCGLRCIFHGDGEAGTRGTQPQQMAECTKAIVSTPTRARYDLHICHHST